MRWLWVGGLSVLFAGVVAGAAGLSLFACALNLPASLAWLGSCPAAAAIAQAEHLDALTQRQDDLRHRIAQLQGTLAATQCEALPPDPNRPFDAQGWQDGKLDTLYGCWDISGGYTTRDLGAEATIGYPAWQMCFDTEGHGRQIMRDADGVACEGPVSGAFSDAGVLRIDEADNVACGDGGYVHRREFTCALIGGGVVCDTLQPETGGARAVEFQRAARQL